MQTYAALHQVASSDMIILAENIPFCKVLNHGNLRTDLRIRKEVCDTTNFHFSVSLQIYYTSTRCRTLNKSDFIFKVYSELWRPSLGARLLVIKWKGSNQWRIKKYSAHRWVLARKCFAGRCVYHDDRGDTLDSRTTNQEKETYNQISTAK